jgi:glucose/arabinose dehydrogenase
MKSYVRPVLRACLISGLAVTLLGIVPASAPAVPTGFQEDTAISGLTEPTDIAFAPDGRVFVSEKSGFIKEFDSLSDTSATTIVDLRTEVYNWADRGLLGMALDPQFPTRPYLYALYTRDALPGGSAPQWGNPDDSFDSCPDPPGGEKDGCVATGRLVRLTLSGNTVTGQTNLITDWCQQYPSHSIGELAFGPDGALYASGGDGASYVFADWGQAGIPKNPCGDPPSDPGTGLSPPTSEGGALRSQDARTTSDPTGLDGALLRLDPDTGQAMAGNPFGSSSDANQRRIIAYGFRNPFRFAFRPGTGEIWIGDVGSGFTEEIDRLANPTASPVADFGWPCYEGPNRQPSFDTGDFNLCESLYTEGSATGPYFSYQHPDPVVSGDGCSTGSSAISAIGFYPGGPFPGAYDGALFFADYARACMWVMLPGTDGLPDPSRISVFDNPALTPVKLTVGPGGDLFYVNLGEPGTATGSIQRITYSQGNSPPVAHAAADPTSGAAPLTVDFDGTGSSDPDGDTLSYAWDLDGDGEYDDSTEAQPSHTYTAPGTYDVGLKVSDSEGASDTDSVQIQAGNTPPTAQIDAPTAADTYSVGEEIDFSGSASDAQETLPASAYSWSVTINHCPSTCHTHPYESFPGVTGGSFLGPDHEYPSSVTVTLTVTDSAGLTDTDSVTINPRTVQLTVDSSPHGVEIGIDQKSAVTPFTEQVIEGSAHSVIAPSQVSMSGQTYDFESWSDGGAMAHNVTAGADLQLDATFLTPLGTLPQPPPSQVLGESTVSCIGRTATIMGTEGSDRLIGTAGPDVIAGLGGKDELVGKGGDDLICGGAGADALEGGAGMDLLKGGPGRDLCLAGHGAGRLASCEFRKPHPLPSCVRCRSTNTAARTDTPSR